MSGNDTAYGIFIFFNDIIGSVIPGIILLYGVFVFSGIPDLGFFNQTDVNNSINWILLTSIAFIIGHAVNSIHAVLMNFQMFIYKLQSMKLIIDFYNKHSIIKYRKYEPIKFKEDYAPLISYVDNHVNGASVTKYNINPSLSYYRNIVMTLSKEAGHTARRFMFISLACHASATSIGLTFLISLVFLNPRISQFELLLFATLSLLISMALNARGFYFKDISDRVAFPIATAELLIGINSDEK
ncbi:MAG: hypothetical protein ABW168_08335 [Sedimenticola sp.]